MNNFRVNTANEIAKYAPRNFRVIFSPKDVLGGCVGGGAGVGGFISRF
jgi:hypothetical protein